MASTSVNCKINGVACEFPKGTTIIQAFHQIKKDIAHYCWHPGLKVAGVCRLCLVEIEGMNKLQIACNTEIQDGMVITNTSDTVKEAVRWGLEFHLINHPLDCPICDQAGECSLQDQYMKFGTYRPSMSESKVKKRKVVDLGSKIVLDTERCILCSRCVRFTDEVTKTKELGIFHRGDKSEIGCFKDKPLDNNYAGNTVDICPVGALTSKDFRFQQRVWYMKTKPSICTGCSTGCNLNVDYNEEGPWRLRPRYNAKINGHWMCDKGRGIYRNSKPKHRLTKSWIGKDEASWLVSSSQQALKEIQARVKNSKISFILTGQYTNEEYQQLQQDFATSSFYHWLNHPKEVNDFDKLLLRGDKNPNTKGLKKYIKKLLPLKQFSEDTADCVLIAGPENPEFFVDIPEVSKMAAQKKQIIWLSTWKNTHLPSRKDTWQIPLKTCMEKGGSVLSHSQEQKFTSVDSFAPDACSLNQLIDVLQNKSWETQEYSTYFKHNQFLSKKEKVW